jgi:hypothetical protein
MLRPTKPRALFVLFSVVIPHWSWIIQVSFFLLHPAESFLYHQGGYHGLKEVTSNGISSQNLQLQQGRRHRHRPRRPPAFPADIVAIPTYVRSNLPLTGVEEKGTKDTVSSNNTENHSDDEDSFFRTLNTVLPKRVLYLIRDSGLLRALANLAVLSGIPSLATKYPSAIGDLLRLLGKESFLSFLSNIGPISQLVSSITSSSLLTVNVRHDRLVYGDHPSQFVQMVHPTIPSSSSSSSSQQQDICSDTSSSFSSSNNPLNHDKVLIFVHGGAWGSGFPSMYLLSITPFINMGYTCCVVGYRTYPDAGCIEQAQDVVTAIRHIQSTMGNERRKQQQQQQQQQQQIPDEAVVSEYDYTLLSHSSGTHICSLAFVKGMFSPPMTSPPMLTTPTATSVQQSQRYSGTTGRINRFIGLAGVFDIRKHYQFEQRRGVARFSPMAPACSSNSLRRLYGGGGGGGGSGGHLLTAWRANSPLHCLEKKEEEKTLVSTTKMFSMMENDDISSCSFPQECIFLHGALDTTCPATYTTEFGNALHRKISSIQLLNNDEDTVGLSVSSSLRSRLSSEKVSSTVQIEILPEVDHAGMVLELMFGGPTLDVVGRYLFNTTTSSTTTTTTNR